MTLQRTLLFKLALPTAILFLPAQLPLCRASPSAGPASRTSSPTAAATSTTDKAITVNFVHAPVVAILKYFAETTGITVVLKQPIEGTATIVSARPCSPDEFERLINVILGMNGYVGVREGTTFTIGPK